MNILVTGYYGHGNFGDDLLSLVSVRLLRARYPGATIHLLCTGPNEGNYLKKLVGDDVVIATHFRGDFDLVFHGGGGTYFDFREHGLLQRAANGLVEMIGPLNYCRAENAVRQLVWRGRYHAQCRIGAGIGIGTYTAGSPAWREALHSLTDFDQLAVRDETSLEHAKELPVTAPLHLGSDLAFLNEYWWEKSPQRDKGSGRIGIVLRNWSVELSASWQAMIADVRRAHEVELILFDSSADHQLGEAANLPVRTWQPANESVSDFCDYLAGFDVLVTARAHGAIVGAVLGVPTVIVEIEPKLRTIHDMLPNASLLVPATGEGISDAVARAAAIDSTAIATDVSANQQLMQRALDTVLAGVAEV